MDKSDPEKASGSQEEAQGEAQALVDGKLNKKLKISRILKKIGILGKVSILESTQTTLSGSGLLETSRSRHRRPGSLKPSRKSSRTF